MSTYITRRGIWAQLIPGNPSAWGYMFDASSARYIPIPDSQTPPVTLHLVGSKPDNVDLQIPPEIMDVVTLHSGLEYDDFYALIATMCVTQIFRECV